MVSEDSDQIVSGLFTVHRLRNLCDVRQARVGQMDAAIDHRDAASELLEISLLGRMQLVCREERNDRVDQVAPTTHHEPIQMLSVVVVSPIRDHAAHFEEALKLSEAPDALGTLCHSKLVSHLIPGFVASAIRPTCLSDKPDGEASLSVHKASDLTELDQSFLLISCTRHIVTVPPACDGTRSAGFSGVPAYGQMRTARLPVRGAAFYLRHSCYTSPTRWLGRF